MSDQIKLLTLQEKAKELGVSYKTLQRRIYKGIITDYIKLDNYKRRYFFLPKDYEKPASVLSGESKKNI